MASGFGAGSNACPTDQKTILTAIVDKIRAGVTAFNNPTLCFISDEPWPTVEVNDNLFCTVAPESSVFSPDDPVGGGQYGTIEVGVFVVSVWSRIELDQLERAADAFNDDDRGLLVLKKSILQTLAGRQLQNTAGNNLLIEHLRPVRANHPPTRQHKDDFSSFGIVFEAPFYWDIGTL